MPTYLPKLLLFAGRAASRIPQDKQSFLSFWFFLVSPEFDCGQSIRKQPIRETLIFGHLDKICCLEPRLLPWLTYLAIRNASPFFD